MTGQIVRGMSDLEYHSRPELSSTEARLILQSPAKYRWRKDHPPLIDDSPKFDVGKAAHAKVLGTGAEIVVVDAATYRTKVAQAQRDEARAAGQTPLLRREFDAVNAMAEAVLAHPTAAALLERRGDAEVSLFTTIDDVAVRARFDFLPERTSARTTAVDLKSTMDASKNAFERSVATYEYAVQRAHYLDTYRVITGDKDAEMIFVAVEKQPPYLVAVYQLPIMWADRGHEMAAKARRTYAECVRANEWPGYGNEVRILDEPMWHVYATEDTQEMEIA